MIRRRFASQSAACRASTVNGVEIADGVLESVRTDVALLQQRHGITPGLAVIVVGARPDSLRYVAKKEALAKSLGLRSVKRYMNPF